METTRPRFRLRRLVGMLALAALSTGLALGLWLLARDQPLDRIGLPVGEPAFTVDVDVPPGAGARRIDADLRRAGLSMQSGDFAFAARSVGADRALKPGRYRITGEMSLLDVVEQMRQGQVLTRTLLVREGATLEETARLVQAADIDDATAFLSLAQSAPVRLGAATRQGMEGFLFPATYRFPLIEPVDATAVLREMHRTFRLVCQELGVSLEAESIQPDGGRSLTPLEWVTLASIVEAEVALPEERSRVARVFLNRLERNIPLQSCATVYHALGERPIPLLRHHLTVDSAYNTYKHRGLPPGPIGNPGRDALKAVLMPEENDYLYFVARGDGGHVFSRTLNEHNRAKRDYKRFLRVRDDE